MYCIKKSVSIYLQNKTYDILKKFSPSVDLKTATEEMNQLGWIKTKFKKNKIGKKCLFRCKRECPKSMYIEFGLDGLIAYESTFEHKHESISRLRKKNMGL